VHVVVVGLLHLPQEAAVRLDGLVADQTLRRDSRPSDISPPACTRETRAHVNTPPSPLGHTHMFDVEEHGGRPVGGRGHRKGHQVLLLVHDGQLVDQDSGLIRDRDSDDL